MNFFTLLLTCLSVLEVSSTITYFLVYFIDYAYCSSEGNYEHLYELVFTLFITAFIASVSNFLFFFKTVLLSIRIFHRHLAVADEKPYRGAYICYHFFFILTSLALAILFMIMSIISLSMYICQIRGNTEHSICVVNPHLVFDAVGYHMSIALILLCLLSFPIYVVKLRPLC